MVRVSALALLVFAAAPFAVAQEAAIRPGGPNPYPSPRPKLQEGDGAYHSQTNTSVEGEYFQQFQGEHEIETIIVPGPNGPRPVVIYNRPPPIIRPPRAPGADIPELIIPWRDILAAGPDDPGAPLPYLQSFAPDFDVESATLITATGLSVPLQVQVITDLTTLPTSFDMGQGEWEIEWGDLSADFLSLGGRYFLLSADVPLGELVPEPSTALMAALAAVFLARNRRRS